MDESVQDAVGNAPTVGKDVDASDPYIGVDPIYQNSASVHNQPFLGEGNDSEADALEADRARIQAAQEQAEARSR